MDAMRGHIKDLLDKGVIRPSDSPYASPAFLVPKKGGTTRMVVDYRGINSLLELEATPMPTIESAFQYLGQAKWFTLLDLNQAYNQIPLDESSKPYTAFVVPWAQYEFNYLPFGLASGSMVLTSLIDKIFGDIKFKYVFSFFDDLCIYSNSTFDDHLTKVNEVISRLRTAGLTINPDKMNVAANQIQFLGHTFANGTLSIHPDRTSPISQFPVPKTVKQLSRFLGMAAFYARFIKDFADITKPLNNLKRKGIKFVWTEQHQAAFDKLKASLVAAPVLRMPDFTLPFVLHTDASGQAVGAVLSQEHDGHLLPVAFASRALNKHETNYATIQLECLAVVFALNKFRQYLEHREFEIHTDCSALSWLVNHPRQAGKIARWTALINSFKFNIHHIKGKDNVVADCLSRLFDLGEPTSQPVNIESASQNIMSLFHIPQAFQSIQTFQREDPKLKALLINPNRPPPYSVINGILCHTEPRQNKPRIVVPSAMMELLFKYYHESPNAAHLGITKTLKRVNQHFWAPDLKNFITTKVKTCSICQRCKQNNNSKIGHLASEITTTPWTKIFIDHIGPLPRSTLGNKYILTVVDAFSKFALFIPTKTTKTANTINLLTKHIFSIFGPPKYLVSDNVSGFRSNAFKEFCLAFGVEHIFTSPYYPKPSQAERANKNVKVAIRIYHNQNQQLWDKNIHWFQLAFNSSEHEATRFTPAELLMGRKIKDPLQLHWKLDDLLGSQLDPRTRDENWNLALENLRKAWTTRQRQYNKDRQPNSFKAGDWVMFRKHNLSNAGNKINYKLLPLWSNPCIIETFTSPSTVRLVAPKTGKFIRKAHISHLKRYFHPSNIQLPT